MQSGEKHYIKFFGLRVLKIRFWAPSKYHVYLFCIPLLTINTIGAKTSVTFLFLDILKSKIGNFLKFLKLICTNKKNKNSKKHIIEKFKSGKKLKICLMTSRPGMWNYDYLYKILKSDERFDVIPFIMPDPLQGKQVMLDYLEASMRELQAKGLDPVSGWDYNKDRPLGLRREINPDIILYSDFWKPHFMNEFYVTSFLDKITLLNEYGYSVMQEELVCNFEMNNLVDVYFRQTDVHKQMAMKLMDNKAKNVVTIGSPKLDAFLDENYQIHDPWKEQNKPKKRIIWAPHHCKIAGSVKYYCCNAFWELYDVMLEIAEKYKDEIQIAFRPHPMLKSKVAAEWGADKANEYWSRWEELDNTQFANGNFIDLFLTSDAMIMDCCSFLAEYTAVNKPLFYTRTKTSRLFLNEFGEELFQNVYDTNSDLISDIENFIRDVVIGGNDYKKETRTKLVQKYFGKINGGMSSENLYLEIINYLEKGDV